jgi:DNA-binding transcriptional MerR regulator
MASLKEVKEYFEAGELGRKVPLEEMKVLSKEERDDLASELDKLTPEERTR